jgi:hypothetical protein
MKLFNGLLHGSIISSIYLTYRTLYITNYGILYLISTIYLIRLLYLNKKTS